MEKEDIRKVIRVDEEDDKSNPEQESRETQNQEYEVKKYLTPEEIEEKIDGLKGKLPSFVLKDLKENLSKRLITQSQLDEVISRTVERFKARDQLKKIHDLSTKIEQLSTILERSNFTDTEISTTRIYEDKGGEKMESEQEKKEIKESGSQEQNEKIVTINRKKDDPEHKILYEMSGARLGRLPESMEGLMLTLKWLEFLLERVGHTGLENVLEYYVDVGWVSDEVLSRMLRMAKGVKTIHDDAEWRPQGFMTAQDHIQSLLFIERLRGRMVDRNLLDHIDREVSRIKRRSEELHGI